MMNKFELASLLMYECRNTFSQVSEPQYYEGEGPFIIALDEVGGEFVFYFFAIVDVDEFLATPDASPRAFAVEDFFHMAADRLDLSHIKHTGQYFRLTIRKVVPDDPACRLALQSLGEVNEETAARILLVGRDGVWHSGKTIRDNPPLLS